MTVLFDDIHHEDALTMAGQRIVGSEFDEVLYAGDTICIAQTTAAMKRLLKAIETEGAKYGLKLNKDKCEYLTFGEPAAVKFEDGQKNKQQKQK